MATAAPIVPSHLNSVSAVAAGSSEWLPVADGAHEKPLLWSSSKPVSQVLNNNAWPCEQTADSEGCEAVAGHQLDQQVVPVLSTVTEQHQALPPTAVVQPVFLPFPVFMMPWTPYWPMAAVAAAAPVSGMPVIDVACRMAAAPSLSAASSAPNAPSVPHVGPTQQPSNSVSPLSVVPQASAAASGRGPRRSAGAAKQPSAVVALGPSMLSVPQVVDHDEATSRSSCSADGTSSVRWQEPNLDQKHRLQVARSVAVYLKQMGVRCSTDDGKLGRLVRRIEVALYMAAPSLHAYKDPRSLARRIVLLGKALKQSGLKVKS